MYIREESPSERPVIIRNYNLRYAETADPRAYECHGDYLCCGGRKDYALCPLRELVNHGEHLVANSAESAGPEVHIYRVEGAGHRMRPEISL